MKNKINSNALRNARLGISYIFFFVEVVKFIKKAEIMNGIVCAHILLNCKWFLFFNEN